MRTLIRSLTRSPTRSRRRTLTGVATLLALVLPASLPAAAGEVYYARPGAPHVIPHVPTGDVHPGIGFAIQDHDRYAYRGRRHYDEWQYRYPRDTYPRFRDYDPGPEIAAGILGLATGIILGGGAYPPPALRVPRATAYDADAIAWCARRYRSFDPHSFTFLGYDGRRHLCRAP